jgi:hypothetical protein
MRSFVRVVIASAVAYLAFGLVVAAMLFIPGTPHRRSLQLMALLHSYRDSPELTGAGAAFEEWLRVGRQAAWLEATVVTAIAAGIAGLLWRKRAPLSWLEVLSIVALFTAGAVWRRGPDINAPLATTVVIFGAVLAATNLRHRLGSLRAGAA